MNTPHALVVKDDVANSAILGGAPPLVCLKVFAQETPERPHPVGSVALTDGVADLSRSEVRYHDGHRCELSTREAEVLGYLAAHRGRAVSRDELLRQVWHLDPRRMITRTIDMHIAKLRHKLREHPEKPKLLLTIRGEGYMWVTRDA